MLSLRLERKVSSIAGHAHAVAAFRDEGERADARPFLELALPWVQELPR